MARVYTVEGGVVTRFLDVTGSLDEGYEIHRQVIGPDDESETWWRLTHAQSQALRGLLEPAVAIDDLLPISDLAEPFDQLVLDALGVLSPPVEPFTWRSFD